MTDRPSDPQPHSSDPNGFDAERFAALVLRYFEGEPTADQLRSLNSQLAGSEQARSMFVRMTRIHGVLTERAITRSGEPPGGVFDDAGNDEVFAASSLHETVVVPALNGSLDADDYRQPVDMPVLSTSFRPMPTRRDSRRRWWMLGGAAGLAAIVSLVLLLPGSNPEPKKRSLAVEPETAATQPADEKPVQKNEIKPRSMIPGTGAGPIVHAAPKLVDSLAATWGDGKMVLEPEDPIPAGPMVLSAGWARIDFWTGTSVVIEAPAKFEISSDSQVMLTAGRLTAEVPPPGHGFTVVAPLCRVVDLGTDFGVSVDASGRNDVSVYKGSVQFHEGMSAPVTVLEGAGRRIESAGSVPVETKVEATAFVRKAQFERWTAAVKSPAALSPVDRWRIYTEQLSRDPSLKLLYTFDGQSGGGSVLQNRASITSGQFALGPSENDPDWTDGRLPGLAALDLHPGRMQRLLLPAYPMSQTGSMTVATWVYARTTGPWSSIAKSWGDTKCGAFHLGLTSDQDLEIELDGATPGGPVVREGAASRFPTGRWVLVAFVTDGKKVDLYRDGQVVGTGPSRPLSKETEIKSLAIGFKTGDDGVEPLASQAVGYWDGMIGDFALFDRALSPAEIRRMYEVGKP